MNGAQTVAWIAIAYLAIPLAAYGLYTVTSKNLLDDGHSPEGVMAVAFGLGAILLAPVLAIGDTAWLL